MDRFTYHSTVASTSYKRFLTFARRYTSTRTHYDVLGVSKSASAKEIKAAFYVLSKKSYDILRDPSERKRYDTMIDMKEAHSRSPPPRQTYQDYDYERYRSTRRHQERKNSQQNGEWNTAYDWWEQTRNEWRKETENRKRYGSKKTEKSKYEKWAQNDEKVLSWSIIGYGITKFIVVAMLLSSAIRKYLDIRKINKYRQDIYEKALLTIDTSTPPPPRPVTHLWNEEKEKDTGDVKTVKPNHGWTGHDTNDQKQAALFVLALLISFFMILLR